MYIATHTAGGVHARQDSVYTDAEQDTAIEADLARAARAIVRISSLDVGQDDHDPDQHLNSGSVGTDSTMHIGDDGGRAMSSADEAGSGSDWNSDYEQDTISALDRDVLRDMYDDRVYCSSW
jgi:hypothetical protein